MVGNLKGGIVWIVCGKVDLLRCANEKMRLALNLAAFDEIYGGRYDEAFLYSGLVWHRLLGGIQESFDVIDWFEARSTHSH